MMAPEKSIRDFIPLRMRVVVIGVFMLSAFLAIVIRLYQEQISSAEERRRKIYGQSVKKIRLPGRRGNIFTSDGVRIAGNAGTLRLLFFPEEMQRSSRKKTIDHMEKCAADISAAVGRENVISRKKISRHLYTRPAMPLPVMDNLTKLEAARAMEFASRMPGVELVGHDVRYYPEKSFAAQIIGYTGAAGEAHSTDRKKFSMYVPDVIGRQGAERAFDRIRTGNGDLRGLLGEAGFSQVRVDNIGHVRSRDMGRDEPRNGNHVFLTLDSRAQKLAEGLIGSRRGAFVVLDASSGAVLAAASAPGFDLGRFTPVIPADYYSALRNDDGRPLINRATAGSYTPGSIMKVLVALAMMNKGHDPGTVIHCPGYAEIGNTRLRCASRYGHGDLNLSDAIKYSCNTYMIEGCRKLAVEDIAAVMKSAGIGSRTGLEIEEAAGVLPSRREKYRRYKTRWNAFDTALISIGQGMVMVTPLQAANIAAAIANGGVWYRPHLLDRVTDYAGRTLYRPAAVPGGRLLASPEAIKTVREGMFKVVNSSDGSGRRARRPGLTVYGKTGSAEVGPKHDRTLTTWFIAYVKYRSRTYASALVFEDGKSGGSDCAPLTGIFFQRFLQVENDYE